MGNGGLEVKVGIVGATGYGGAELVRILHAHPEVSNLIVYSSSKQGSFLSETYPHVSHLPYRLEEIDPVAMNEANDIVFLAAPTGVSSQLAPVLLAAGCTVIDLAGDFRLQEVEDYEKWYRKTPAPEEWIKRAVYGLSETNKEQIKTAQFIANPGCYPTASILALAPLAKAGMIKAESVIIDAKSGVSGAGRSASLGTIYSELNENLKIYKVNEHQHIPEIEQHLSLLGYTSPITFQTHLVPMTRGIMATIYVNLKQEMTEQQVRDLYKTFYADAAFVRLRERGQYPATKEVLGSNNCDIGFSLDERTGRLIIVSVIDNVMKGAAGQAVQNANILYGFAEQTGLQMIPVYP